MAIHTGAAESRDGDFFGRPLNRLARILGLAQIGQAPLSEVARTLALEEAPVMAVRELGVHALRGLDEADGYAKKLGRRGFDRAGVG